MLLANLLTATLAVCAPLAAMAAIISPRRPQESAIPSECIAAVVEAPPLPPFLSFTDVEIPTVAGEPLMVSTVVITVGLETVTVREPPAATSSSGSSTAPAPIPVSPSPTQPAASPTRVVDCKTVCTCDEKSPNFFDCISSPDCESCLRRSQVPLETPSGRLF
ncbi:hypothetical protein ACKVWC_009587 [Pyricularia oryzae]|nr:hypothetical protein MCOR31_008129 [Pyricularia oryzae]KAI6418683.1 hypothetical protein MCOR21_010691 [Pyricularia oryzae]KAI6436942.1 hypothetical protein MCOR24_000420 [Pyricularia oryzae]KAI6445438.1 hypothetical protein MCOR17_010977 [Pyricularia oryzae]KAI6446822.1 hypothetical protein MCOR15_010391 [Pyricularia oryzae]